MRVLFLIPPFYRFRHLPYQFWPPLGPMYIGAILQANNIDVIIHNLDRDTCQRIELDFLKYTPHMFNPSWQEFQEPDHPVWVEAAQVIRRYAPDILGLGMMTSQFDVGVRLAQIAKHINPKIVVAAGGMHPTVLAEEVLQHESFDYVFVGEGENSFLQFVQVLRESGDVTTIHGLCLKDKSSVVSTGLPDLIEDLDMIPNPYRYFPHLVDPLMGATVITSRGCPFSCRFCAHSAGQRGRLVRYRSPENVLEEITYLRKELGVRRIHFVDDAFSLNLSRAGRICDMIIEQNLDITWWCQVTPGHIPIKLARKMRDAGCTFINMGVESGNPDILKSLNRPFTVNHVREAVKTIRNAGLHCGCNFILGHLDETEETLQDSLRFAKELTDEGAIAYLAFLVPFPGAEIHRDLVNAGKLRSPLYFTFFRENPNVFQRDHITCERLYREYVRLRWYTASRDVSSILGLPRILVRELQCGLRKPSMWFSCLRAITHVSWARLTPPHYPTNVLKSKTRSKENRKADAPAARR